MLGRYFLDVGWRGAEQRLTAVSGVFLVGGALFEGMEVT